MRILFIGYLNTCGGAERMLIALANAMACREHDVYLISLVFNSPQYAISNKVVYKFFPDFGTNKLLRIVNRFFRLKNYIKEIEPDLIVNFGLTPACLCAFMGRKIARKTIYAERGDPHCAEYNGVLRLIRWLSFKKIGGFVFQSQKAQQYWNKDIIKRSCVIQNPVFLKNNDVWNPDTCNKCIVTIGRLHRQKNQAMLIDAFNMLPSDKREYILEIYGDGPLKDMLQEKIEALGLSSRVFLKGTFVDIHSRIASARMFVLSSDYEGMPNALLEAMALGIPCISTNYAPGSVKEIMVDGVNGIVVPRNNVDALSQAMNVLIDNKKLSYQIGMCAAQDVTTRLAPARIYDLWEQFFYIKVN